MRRTKTKSPATPAQLRVALENLLADVTSGALSGRVTLECQPCKRIDTMSYPTANRPRGAPVKIHPANAERSHGIFCNSPIVAIW